MGNWLFHLFRINANPDCNTDFLANADCDCNNLNAHGDAHNITYNYCDNCDTYTDPDSNCDNCSAHDHINNRSG